MRRLTALVICILLVLASFASCGKEMTAYELVSSAVEKSSSLNDIELEQKVDMKLDMMGMSMDIPITMTMKGKSINTDSPILYSDITTSMMGTTVDSIVYIESGYVYLTTLGESYKMSLSEVADEYDIGKDLTAVFYCPGESVFEGVEAVKNEDGSRTVTLVMTQEDYIAAYRPYYDSLMGEIGLDGDASLSDISVSLTVNKDGYLSTYKMSCAIAMTLTEMGMDVAVTATIDTEINFVNIGGNVTITPPEGYQGFTALE